MLPSGIRLLFLLSEYSQCICKSGKQCYHIVMLSSQNLKKSDGTKRSKSSSYSFKLRRHKSCMGAEGYIKESWHKRTSQNDQRQGKNDYFVKIFTIYHPSHHFLYIILKATKPYQIQYTQLHVGVLGIHRREYKKNYVIRQFGQQNFLLFYLFSSSRVYLD